MSRLTIDQAVATSYLPYLANRQVQARFAPFAERTVHSGPQLLAQILTDFDLRLRDGVDATVAGLARLAILIGAAYEHLADPLAPWNRREADRPWPLPVVASAMLLRQVTEPAAP